MAIQSTVSPVWTIDMDDANHSSSEEAFVIDDLLELFVDHTPINVNQPMVIGLDYNDGPITLWDNLHVNLNTKGPQIFNQTVFQLAHELAHFTTHVAPLTVTWFNEVLCEIAAETFLDLMYEKWASSSDQVKQGYAFNFALYKSIMLQQTISFDLEALQDADSDVCLYLQQNATNYNLNRTIAMQMVPLAHSEPSFWKLLPYTFNLKHAETLAACLDELSRRLPYELKHIATDISTLFPH